jgi:hypothetical protein
MIPRNNSFIIGTTFNATQSSNIRNSVRNSTISQQMNKINAINAANERQAARQKEQQTNEPGEIASSAPISGESALDATDGAASPDSAVSALAPDSIDSPVVGLLAPSARTMAASTSTSPSSSAPRSIHHDGGCSIHALLSSTGNINIALYSLLSTYEKYRCRTNLGTIMSTINDTMHINNGNLHDYVDEPFQWNRDYENDDVMIGINNNNTKSGDENNGAESVAMETAFNNAVNNHSYSGTMSGATAGVHRASITKDSSMPVAHAASISMASGSLVPAAGPSGELSARGSVHGAAGNTNDAPANGTATASQEAPPKTESACCSIM